MRTFARRVFVAAMVIGAIALTAYVFRWILLLLGGALLAILFRMAAEWLSAHTTLSLRSAIVIVLVAAGLVILGTTWAFGSKLIGQADELMSKLSAALGTVQQSARRYPNLRNFISASNVALPTKALLSDAFEIVAAIVLVLFTAAYGCIDPGVYIRGALRFFPARRRPKVQTVLGEAGSALRAWIFGQLIAMAVVGLVTAVGLLLIGVPMALPLAAVATLLTFVPYVGAITSSIPALLLGFTVSTHTAFYVAIVFLIAHILEGYVVVPIVQHRLVYLPPALILANLYFMKLVVGIVGIVLGTPLLVIVMVLVERFYFEEAWSERQDAA